MERVLLVRHAFAGSNRDALASCEAPGEGLTDEGTKQARELAAVLAGEAVGVALTSRFARTQQTLALALDGRGLPVAIVPELDEIDFGSFDGGPLDAYRAWAAAHSPDEDAPGGGESRAKAAARFAHGLGLVLARPESQVLVVGHALFIRYVLDAAVGLVPAARMTPVEHASPHPLGRDQVERSASVLGSWGASATPRFRCVRG
jgi:probable phosphoglycerate mutase